METGLHYKPNHLLTLYGGGRVRLPVTEKIFTELLTLPLHPGMRETDVDEVCAVVARELTEGGES